MLNQGKNKVRSGRKTLECLWQNLVCKVCAQMDLNMSQPKCWVFWAGFDSNLWKASSFWRIRSVAQLQLQVHGATGGGLACDSSLLDLMWIGWWLKIRCPCGILGTLWKRLSIALVRDILQWVIWNHKFRHVCQHSGWRWAFCRLRPWLQLAA